MSDPIHLGDPTPIEEGAIMKPPTHTEYPFFAYGLFKPGQLAFFQIRDCVSGVIDPAYVRGELRLRDGLPIIDPEARGLVKGALLTFRQGAIEEAYHRIAKMEPGKQYRWEERDVEDQVVNVLVGRFPQKGSVPCEFPEWDGWDDPLFTAALEVVEETLDREVFQWNLKPMFRLQMAYLLLWSAIERYVALRYHLGDKAGEKVGHLAEERAFADGLLAYSPKGRAVARADSPREKRVLDALQPAKALDYYYQVRCNITHRGKGATRDHDLLEKSLRELLPIFRKVLAAAKEDAMFSET